MPLMRILKLVLVGFFALHISCALGQSSPLRQAEKKMAQESWIGARQAMIKALRKDSLNVEAEWLLARWFFSAHNPSQQIDSAYRHCQGTLRLFQKLSSKQKEKLKRDQFDSSAVVLLRTKIDSAAFDRARQINTEKSYSYFLEKFAVAVQRPTATELRDEVAFLDALRQNSYSAFDHYIQHYPQSHRATEAKQRYEKLLFAARTKDKKLKSYEAFVKEFTQSPYRPMAEKNIYEVLTIGGTVSDFSAFIKNNPATIFSNQARNVLFHLLREGDEKIPDELLTDSLKKIMELNQLVWAPIYKNGKYGFIDSRGEEKLPLQFEKIEDNYKCGVSDDVLITNMGLIGRNGKSLSTSTVVKDLGYGFLKVGDSTCAQVLHKSGKIVIEGCIQNARVLYGRFLVVTKNNLQGLYTLSGRMVFAHQWNKIEMIEGVLLLDRLGKKILCTTEQLPQIADGNVLDEKFVFDEVRRVAPGKLLVRNGSLEGIMDTSLQFSVPLTRQLLIQMPFGLIRKINDRFVTDVLPELETTAWEKFNVYRQWLQLLGSLGEKLVDTHSKKIIEPQPDSIWFENGLAFAQRGDSIHVHLNSLSRISLARNSKITFVKSADSVRYFFIEQKNKKILFSIETGEKLFASDFDQVESLTKDLFVVTKKNKKGLMNRSGKIILPTEYDALIAQAKNLISLLKEKKFGLLHIPSNRWIKPFSERNILPLDSTVLIAFKDGHCGLIDWAAQSLSRFEFDEIVPWKENIIWAKKGFEWSLMDFRLQKKIVEHIKSFHWLKNQPDEKLAMVKQENYFGVLSNVLDMIIPPSFTFIANLGTEDEPFYFSSKEVEEAGLVVVIYYDRNGKLLRKQVYEEEEYSKIVCTEN